MRQVSLREFRTRGTKVLGSVPRGETVLLAGRKGPEFFLVPVLEDIAIEEHELRRAMAKASLRRNWDLASAPGAAMSEQEVDEEISMARGLCRPKKSK